jgi:hypothetical protein
MKIRAVLIASIAVVALAVCRPAEKGAEVTRAATVTDARGIELAPGARCTVRVRNESRGGFPCRLEITCGDVPLFGGRIPGGYARCEARAGKWVSASDDELPQRDGDPAISVDFERGDMRVDTGRAQIVARLDPVSPTSSTVARR